MEAYRSWAETLERTFHRFWDAFVAFVPDLVGALVLLAVGWIVARIARTVLRRMLRGIVEASAAWTARAGLAHALPWPIDRIVAEAGFWLIVVFFVTAAADVLHLPAVAEWLGQLLGYLPQLAVGIIIVLVGYGLSRPVGEAVAAAAGRARISQSAALGSAARALFLVIIALLGVEQLGLDITLLVNLVTILVAAAVGALAFAFGLGAGPAVRNIVAARYVQRAYRVGQRVRIGEIEGEILEFTPTAVVLDAPDGRASVPAQAFGEQASVLVTRDGPAGA